jgi:1,4-dihydroxy-2-naphthoyl-CoA hydrolase
MEKSLSEFRVAFDQVDAGGILFYGHVFTIAHRAYEEFISKKLRISWSEWFKNDQWIVPLKSVSAEFMRPLLGGELYQISISIKEISNSSFVLQTKFYDRECEYCSIQSIHVFVNKSTLKKMDIPSEIRILLDGIK